MADVIESFKLVFKVFPVFILLFKVVFVLLPLSTALFKFPSIVLALFIVEVRVEFLLSTTDKLFTNVVFLVVAVCIFVFKEVFKDELANEGVVVEIPE